MDDLYQYTTPHGYGDTFFIYALNGEDIPIVNGHSYTLLGLAVQDADFVCRVWSGGALFVNATTGTVQMYDGVRNAWFQLPILQGNFPPAMAMLPEKVYRVNTNFRFDLTNVALKVNNNGTNSVYADQMAWYGVKRWPGTAADPAPSHYRYYEKEFSYPINIKLTGYGPTVPATGLAAPTLCQIPIFDFDFELRKIYATPGSGSATFGTGCSSSGTIQFTGAAGTVINVPAPSGINTPFSLIVAGHTVTIIVATNGTGTETTTIAAVIAAIAANPAATAILSATQLVAGLMPAPVAVTLQGSTAYNSQFKMTLYDATWRSRSNIPLLQEFICFNPTTTSNAPNNTWPTPPLLYPVNSVIRFDVFSLIPSPDPLPVFVTMLFKGVRRIAC